MDLISSKSFNSKYFDENQDEIGIIWLCVNWNLVLFSQYLYMGISISI